ncbi:copper chaperone PCu(A)C [Rappaport israeli]|uniref:copper chaperone PCu(A)C n=1 Tax=Rappaport israeli TaxID=1839807 RepID=UPI000AFEA7DE|nr:copper chaperone PCu(A)C [Rappaport israeli]
MAKMKTAVVAMMGMLAVSVQAKVAVSECYIQEVIAGNDTTAAFMKMHNDGQALALVKAEIPELSLHVEMHEMVMKDHVMSMQEIPTYKLETGEHEFKKGGYHLMVMDIEHLPTVGESYAIDLHFDNGEKVSCDALVLSIDEVMQRYRGNHAHDGSMHNHAHDGSMHNHAHDESMHNHAHAGHEHKH